MRVGKKKSIVIVHVGKKKSIVIVRVGKKKSIVIMHPRRENCQSRVWEGKTSPWDSKKARLRVWERKKVLPDPRELYFHVRGKKKA